MDGDSPQGGGKGVSWFGWLIRGDRGGGGEEERRGGGHTYVFAGGRHSGGGFRGEITVSRRSHYE